MSKTHVHEKTFRTHDGSKGNRLSITAWIDENGNGWIGQVSGIFQPTEEGEAAITRFVRVLNCRARDWIYENKATVTLVNSPRILIKGDWG